MADEVTTTNGAASDAATSSSSDGSASGGSAAIQAMGSAVGMQKPAEAEAAEMVQKVPYWALLPIVGAAGLFDGLKAGLIGGVSIAAGVYAYRRWVRPGRGAATASGGGSSSSRRGRRAR